MKTRSFAALLLLVAGCSGSTTHDPDNTNNPSELERKRLAAESIANGSSMGDPCAANGWYGDGVCDSFCSGTGDATDTDCVPPEPGGSEPVVCAQFLESSDLECTRSSDDPCLFQDPDCDYPGDPEEPVACALIEEVANGVCSRLDNDPCKFQDPDCDGSIVPLPPVGYLCEAPVLCDALPPTCPDGQVPSIENGCWSDCVAKELCVEEPVLCADFIEVSDGVCSRAPEDPCISQDPDCTFGCDAYLEESDGVCSRDPGDPCISQDPDCVVVCAAYIEESNGVCSRDANDPCRSQDPDCDVACAEYIEEPDGECTRPSTDPCMFQDPDCSK